jgi:peptide-methionine (R)-S-oxide reductase
LLPVVFSLLFIVAHIFPERISAVDSKERLPAQRYWRSRHLAGKNYSMTDERAMSPSEAEWKKKLTPEEYEVLRKKGTEAPFSGRYNEMKKPGRFVCKACGAELFSSEAKYDSGSGWPSFVRPVSDSSVDTAPDTSGGMERTELLCNRCQSHLGHVFDDGPETMPDGSEATGKRYCVNSLALDFEEEEKDPSDSDT